MARLASYTVQVSHRHNDHLDLACPISIDTDADEMMDEEHSSRRKVALADKSNIEVISDITDSEEEINEQELNDSLQQESCSSRLKQRAAPGSATEHRSQKQLRQQQGQSTSSSSRSYQQNRKRKPPQPEEEDLEEELDCNSEQYVAEVKRLRESKLKHNKNEQLRLAPPTYRVALLKFVLNLALHTCFQCILINAQRMHEGDCSQFVCLSVCVCVCVCMFVADLVPAYDVCATN